MTTKPRARKFRLRRGDGSAAAAGGATGTDMPFSDGATDDGFGGMDFRKPDERADARRVVPARPVRTRDGNGAGAGTGPTPVARAPAAEVVRGGRRRPDPDQQSDLGPDQEIEAIRQEGLTGRQLRIARRVAQKHGINAVSDLDAVRQLRQRGIDPFALENMLQLVSSDQLPARQDEVKLPQTRPAQAPAPAQAPVKPQPEPMTGADVAREVRRIQKDIARRRRRRLVLLMARLLFFVMLPTLFAGMYYYRYATPMYATNTEFVIQQAESQSGGGGFGGVFGGSPMATSQDAVTVQSYLQSRDAMLRLDRGLGFRAHFSSPQIDGLQRLAPDASNEAAYKLYRRHVKIGFDPTEGIVRMEVIAADPQVAKGFAEALIGYAEEQVDNLTQRLREDQMAGARDSYEEAETKMLAAQQRVVALQEQRGVLSAQAEASALMSQISTFEVELQNERLRLQELLQNSNPNSARVSIVRNNISRLEQLVVDLRAKMTEGGDGGSASLARISGELMIAEQDLQTRTLLLQQALQQMETARIEANRQVRYLSLGVSPIAPDEAAYPRALENTFLALLIFGGIYLMLSLTASVLREQVSG